MAETGKLVPGARGRVVCELHWQLIVPWSAVKSRTHDGSDSGVP